MDALTQFWANFGFILTCLLVGYIFGSIPVALIIGKVFYKKDPRDYGSHNLGGTNSGRIFGKKVGLIIIALDMIKTLLPVWIMYVIMVNTGIGSSGTFIYSASAVRSPIFTFNGTAFQELAQYYYLVGIGTIIGHCYPIFAQLRGGKGVSNFMGLIFGCSWFIGLICGLLYFLFLKLTRYVSVTSMVVAGVGVIHVWIAFLFPNVYNMFAFWGPTMTAGLEFAIAITFLAMFMVYKHLPNIKRLLEGTESKIKWMLSKKEKEALKAQEEQAV